MLLVQTVNSWKDPAGRIASFAELLKRVAEIEGIRRIRFTSPHPSDFHVEIVEVIENVPQVCNQVHLPVQSGSTTILRRMKRDYTREEYLRRVDFIKKAQREIALSTDIIVGFPGETQEDFEETLSLMQEVRYDSIFSFKYSPRPGTQAYSFEDAVPEEEKSRRLMILQEFQRKIQLERNASFVGKELEIFVEGKSHRDIKDLMGRTTQNKIINFSGSSQLLGKFANVCVTNFSPNSLQGQLIS